MGHNFRLKASCFLVTWLSCLTLHGITVTDTLPSPHSKQDRVVISYNVEYSDGRATISFNKPRKLLAGTHNIYKANLEEVKVLFFRKNGGFGNQVSFTGKAITPFTKPQNVRLNENDGFFSIDEEPTLTFEISNGEKPTLDIPIYLAKYNRIKKKVTNYHVFSNCGNLSVKLFKESSKKQSTKTEPTTRYEVRQVEEKVAERIEADDGNSESFTPEDEARLRINTIRELLPQQDKLPFDESLSSCIDGLRGLEYKVPGSLQSQIHQILNECDRKKRSLEDDADQEQQAAQAAAEQKAQEEAAAAQEKADEEAKKAEEENKKQEKRNLWMIIGGIILGVLGFGGNQVAQHMRNTKNQKNMMDMQQSVMKRAENEAKRRAQSYARNKTHQMVGQAKQKGRQAVRSSASKLGDSIKNNTTGNRTGASASASNSNQTSARSYKAKGKNNKNDNGSISI